MTFNRRDLLSDCLKAIEAQTHRPDVIIVVDNASSDDTSEFLSARDWALPHQVHRLNRNYGGALGFAVGMRAALAAGADSVWLMDDDAIATPSALEHLIEDTKVTTRGGRRPAFTCSLVVWRDGSVARMNIPRANAQWNESVARVGRPVVDVDSASFVSVLIPTEHVRAVGLPHIGYFKWYDDTEYTLRLRGTYGPGICSLNSIVKHLPSHNEGALPWQATDDDLEHHIRGLRNRVSASVSLRDVRGLLSAARDTALAATNTNQSPRRRSQLIAGFVSGFAYRPPVLPAEDDR